MKGGRTFSNHIPNQGGFVNGLVTCFSRKMKRNGRRSVIPLAKDVIRALEDLEGVRRISVGRCSSGKTPTRSGNRVKVTTQNRDSIQLTVRGNTSVQCLHIFGSAEGLTEAITKKLRSAGFDVLC